MSLESIFEGIIWFQIVIVHVEMLNLILVIMVFTNAILFLKVKKLR